MRFKPNTDRDRPDLGGAMTDISFLLIIFFLVTAVFVTEEGLYSYLPEKDSSPKEVKLIDVVQINLESLDSIVVNKKPYTSVEDVIEHVSELKEKNSKLVAIMSVADGIKYQAVVTLISSLKKAGVSELTMATGTLAEFESIAIPIFIPDEVLATGESGTEQ